MQFGASTSMKTDPIPTTPVESSNIASIGYDALTATLAVVFKGRQTKTKGFRPASIYHYAPCPISMYNQLMRAESKNTYFMQHIRDRSGIETMLWCNCGQFVFGKVEGSTRFMVNGHHKPDCVAVERASKQIPTGGQGEVPFRVGE
jgi:hypothetical protein